MDHEENPMNNFINNEPIKNKSIKIIYPEHIILKDAYYIKYYKLQDDELVEVEYPADPSSGRLKSQDDYKEIEKNFININKIDKKTPDGQNKLNKFQRYNKGPLTGRIRKFFSSNKNVDMTSNFLSSNKNSVSVGGRRKSKKTKRKSLKRGRKTRRKSLKKNRKSRRKVRR